MISLVEGNVQEQRVDAVVNAANRMLYSGSGVCGAIFAAAGPELEEECNLLRSRSEIPCPTGSAVNTKPGKLVESGVRHIIHAVGPVYSEYPPAEAEKLLAQAYDSSLTLAHELGAESIAFPAISTGVYGFPVMKAADLAVNSAMRWWVVNGSHPVDIRFVVWRANIPAFVRAFERWDIYSPFCRKCGGIAAVQGARKFYCHKCFAEDRKS